MRGIHLSRIALLCTILFLAGPASAALAHSPVFPDENHSPDTAFPIDDPAKSWVIYEEIDHADEGEYYRFSIEQGEKIQLALLTPESPAESGFMPSFALLVPGESRIDQLPAYIEVPDGYGAIVVEGTDPGEALFEPFSPGWYYEVTTFTIDAPAEGIYYVVVFGNVPIEDTHSHDNEDDHEQAVGSERYGLVVGYLESFTSLELILIPYSVQRVYRWEGQNQFVTLLPVLLMLVAGGSIMLYRDRKGRTRLSLSRWLAYFAGLAFLGSGVGILYQMVLAFTVAGVHTVALITVMIAAFSFILGVVTLRYAMRESAVLSTRRRIGLVITGLIALFLWSGLYIGPALVITAALVPARSVQDDKSSNSIQLLRSESNE